MPSGLVVVLTTGLPDRSQGGSGIFNELVCRRLLADGYRVHGLFRVSRWFTDDATAAARLAELESLGLEHELLWEDDWRMPRFASGTSLLAGAHAFALCERAVAEHRELLAAADAVVSLDLGWAWALGGVDRPRVSVLGDPYFRRLRALWPFSARDPASWTTLLRHLAVEAALRGPVRRRLATFRRADSALLSFSPSHAAEYRRAGIPVDHARWFTPGPIAPVREPVRSPLRVLHVGSLGSSASRTMLGFWRRELLPALGELPFPVHLRLVGAGDASALADAPANVLVDTPGHLPDAELEAEYRRAAIFLSPMPYPIGVRTRILSALAHAVPVVADPSAASGLPELVAGRDVVYAASGGAVAEELARLAADPAAAERLGSSGRGAWERFFDPAANLPRLLSRAGLGSRDGEAVQLVTEAEPLEGRGEVG